MEGLIRRRRLPHLDVDGATYFVTTCLSGSIPAIGLKALKEYRTELDTRERLEEFTESDWRIHKDKLHFARVDSWLDGKPAVKHFVHDAAANCVRASMLYSVDERYHLIAYCVMPSHLHWVSTPKPSWCDEVARKKHAEEEKNRQAGSLPHSRGAGILPANPRIKTPREIIMHSLKSYTALQCNRLLNLKGTFWQDESYDHVVRSDNELFRIIEYVEQNPVKAGLVTDPLDWKWSSAIERLRCGTRFGDPLIFSKS